MEVKVTLLRPFLIIQFSFYSFLAKTPQPAVDASCRHDQPPPLGLQRIALRFYRQMSAKLGPNDLAPNPRLLVVRSQVKAC